MADLPNLDTANVGYVAFWNALDDGGVSSIEASEVLSASGVVSYDLYDNGVDGRFSGATGREFSFRAKDDGWIIAYMDRENTYQQQSRSTGGLVGYYDIANDWTGPSLANFENHTLAACISQLVGELSNGNTITFNVADVGLYNYEFPDALATTAFAVRNDSGLGSDRDCSFIYTDGTTLHYCAATGRVDDSVYGAAYEFEGTEYVASGSGNYYYGTYDALGQNVVSEPNTEYTLTQVGGGSGVGSGSRPIHGCLITIWS